MYQIPSVQSDLTLVNLAAAGAMQIQACGINIHNTLSARKRNYKCGPVQCFSLNRAGKLFPAEVHVDPWLMDHASAHITVPTPSKTKTAIPALSSGRWESVFSLDYKRAARLVTLAYA